MKGGFWLITEETPNWRKDKTLPSLKKVEPNEARYFETPEEALKDFLKYCEEEGITSDTSHTSEGHSGMFVNERCEDMTAGTYYYQHEYLNVKSSKNIAVLGYLSKLL